MMTSVMMSDDDTVNQDDNYDQNDAIWRLLPESAIFQGTTFSNTNNFTNWKGTSAKQGVAYLGVGTMPRLCLLTTAAELENIHVCENAILI